MQTLFLRGIEIEKERDTISQQISGHKKLSFLNNTDLVSIVTKYESQTLLLYIHSHYIAGHNAYSRDYRGSNWLGGVTRITKDQQKGSSLQSKEYRRSQRSLFDIPKDRSYKKSPQNLSQIKPIAPNLFRARDRLVKQDWPY